ncbi:MULTISPECIES: caspase family protein [Achromobacter]|uniref:Caspase family protein n=1 Tax=Achromobacter spanius TaxID=217203 RepID=A0ABY8GYL1_9BURK|nr:MULTISPECIES: caspase family protein [Achromobacter]WAI81135.1 caspase family protein [Achromobacter spanius]WEX96653.1 caspase family protein [Achromobacter sp. SS2-2022]WFP09631.1 caspase family protein [Achromobacter spanius]
MDRAIVLIGVSETRGRLGRLEAVESAVDLMEQWARGQGIPADRIVRITDGAGEPVTTHEIYRWVRHFVEQDPVEQLIVYFSGHGSMDGRAEFWHLSDAPNDLNAAVNLAVSHEAAQRGSVRHVVFISDACRTVSKDVAQTKLHGAGIFPNSNDANDSSWVDVFYATRLGAPAREVPVRVGANDVYKAVYTEVLFEVLRGAKPQVATAGFIRPRPLKMALKTLVPEYLLAHGFSPIINQDPDAYILSDEEAWLARFDPRVSQTGDGPLGNLGAFFGDGSNSGLPDAKGQASKDGASGDGHAPSGAPALGSPGLSLLSAEGLVSHVLRHSLDEANLEIPSLDVLGEQARGVLQKATWALGLGIPELEASGLVAIGQRVLTVTCLEYDGAIKAGFGTVGANGGQDIVVYDSWQFPDLWTPKQALVQLHDGSGLLVPLFNGCVATLRWDAEERVALHYDPLYAQADTDDMRQLQWLRAVVAEAAKQNVFEVDQASAQALDERMAKLQFLDPALALYAAYAYREIGDIDRIRALRDYMFQRLGVHLFDLALLSRDLLRRPYTPTDFMPATPLLSTGWVLMDALGHALPAELRSLRQYDTGQLWAHYSPQGMQRLAGWLEPSTGQAEAYSMSAPTL